MYHVNDEVEYDGFDDSEVVSIDNHLITLIEELYCSHKLDKKEIAGALNAILYEIQPDMIAQEEYFQPRDITLSYADSTSSFTQTFGHWIDCIDPISGEMNYHNLMMGSTNFEQKNLTVFLDTFGAVEAILKQLTTLVPFNDNELCGALVFMCKRYGVDHEEVLCVMPNVKRK